jgi:hypothetical protein
MDTCEHADNIVVSNCISCLQHTIVRQAARNLELQGQLTKTIGGILALCDEAEAKSRIGKAWPFITTDKIRSLIMSLTDSEND